MKFLKIIARWIFILSIPLFCLSFTIDREFSTAWFYTYGFGKHNVEMYTGFSEGELDRVANEFVDYFNSSEPRIDISVSNWAGDPLFDQTEVLHFQDVKNLVILDRRIMYGSLGVVLLGIIWWQRRDWHRLGRSLLTGGILTAVILLLAMVGIAANFDWLFLQFHLLSFTNNYWYSQGYMTRLFPQEFWFDMAMFTVFITTMVATAFGAVGYIIIRLTRKRENG